MTMVELLIALSIASLILGALGILTVHTSRSFVALSNYTELDRKSRNTLDRLTQIIREAATEVLGADHVVEMPFDTWAEDFGYMTARVPGSMFWLGVTSERVPNPIWHSSTFDLDEDALPIGAKVLAASAIRLLQG